MHPKTKNKKDMKKFYTYLAAMMMILAGFSLTSCEDDDVDRAIDLSGAWTGDMGMFVEVDYINGSVIYDAYRTDIEFTPHNKYSTHGEGYQVDYYDRHCPYRYTCYYFQWTIDNGRIILRYYDNPELNATIYDYRLTSSIFDGRIGNTKFTLDKTADFYRWDRYYGDVVWDSYLYIGWNGSYYYDDYYYTGNYDDYYYVNKRLDTENVNDTVKVKEKLPRIIRHGSHFSEQE